MNLSSIFCQDKAINSLQRAIASDRLHHAYIFAGPDGVGRLTTAKAMAKMLLCKSPTLNNSKNGILKDSCGKCSACTLFEAGNHPDFKHIYKELLKFTKEGKNKKIPVQFPIDVIREFVIDTASSRPSEGNKVIYVLDETEKLNASSQNSLLKILEEPPSHCILILLCTRLDKLLPTTKSRCQTIRFTYIDEKKIVESLVEKGLSNEESIFWSRFTEGSIGSALKFATLETDQGSIFKIKKQVIESVASLTLPKVLELAESIQKTVKSISKAWQDSIALANSSDINRKSQKLIIQLIISLLSDAIKISLDPQAQITNTDQQDAVLRLLSKAEPDVISKMIEKSYKNIEWIEANVNEKLIYEELLLNYSNYVMI